jgi:general stress protein YciG
MDRGRQREIAKKGGQAAHVKGTAHEWTRDEARIAGRKGGLASHRRKEATEGPPEGPAAGRAGRPAVGASVATTR